MNILSQHIREARTKAGLRALDVAIALGVDASYISRCENGTRIPTRAQIAELATVLKVPYQELMVTWLSERIMDELKDEPMAMEALMAAEERIRYRAMPQAPKGRLGSLLKKADQLKRRLDELRHLDNFRVAQSLEVEYIYQSNRIEGNTLTLQETELVINHGLTISGKSMREHLEALNHSDAIALVRDLVREKTPLTERIIKQIHQLVLRGIDRENAGTYRRVPVRIGGSSHTPPEPWAVAPAMEELLSWYDAHTDLHPVLLAAEMHEKLVTIHPFIDGNGRTARLLMNLILLQNGFVIANIKGDAATRMDYYKRLDLARGRSKHAFCELIASTEIHCLEDYIRILGGS